MTRKAKTAEKRPVSKSLREYARGIAGGFLFSLPLLYTNEMWAAGMIAKPGILLIGLLFTLLLLLAYNNLSGIRKDASWWDVVIDSVEEFGIGASLSLFVLWIIGQIDQSMRVDEIVGRVLVEAMVASIGVSVGTAQLGINEDLGNGNIGRKKELPGEPGLNQIIVAICGAFLIGMNVGPTDEIPEIASAASYGKVLLIGLFSLVMGSVVLFYSDFRGSKRFVPSTSFMFTLRGSIYTYLVALLIAVLILWFFGRLQHSAPGFALSQIVVLSFATNLGASAGRLLLQWQ